VLSGIAASYVPIQLGKRFNRALRDRVVATIARSDKHSPNALFS